MHKQVFMQFRGLTPEELQFLEQLTGGLTEQQGKDFVMLYANKRRDPQDILLFTLLGFLGIAGVQRFLTGQIGMGVLYVFTAGLCFIGTLVDLINHRSIAQDYNRKVALESAQMAKMMS
ncbi:MAG: TM2 domain-containing protein [Sphingobacteriaceae bacterium]